jgi:hypothetical protein
MKPTDNINRLIKKLQLKASAELDRKVNDDISAALAETRNKESAITQPNISNIWRSITEVGALKLAVAAAIFIAFGIGFSIGRWSKPTRLAPHSLDVTGYPSAILVHSTTLKTEDGFWRQKALAAMQPRPYAQIQTTKTSLLNAYKQYLKEKHYD